jgi:hypothetical protein
MKAFFTCILALLLFTHCEVNMQNCIEGEGEPQEKEFEVEGFEGISLKIPAKVKLSQGTQSVTIKAPSNYWQELEMDVRRNILTIESNKCFEDKIEATISTPNINYIEIAGSGNINSESFSTTELELQIKGSGDMNLDCQLEDLSTAITGSGDINIKGSAQSLDLSIAGSGDFNAFDLEVLDAKVQIAGSGDTQLNVFNELDVKIAGSGDVMYKGHPKIQSTIVGSGDIIDAN